MKVIFLLQITLERYRCQTEYQTWSTKRGVPNVIPFLFQIIQQTCYNYITHKKQISASFQGKHQITTCTIFHLLLDEKEFISFKSKGNIKYMSTAIIKLSYARRKAPHIFFCAARKYSEANLRYIG